MARQLSEDTRQGILEGAIELMSGREFASITTREISRRARIAETTLFRYFPRKDDILAAIIEEKGEAFFGEVRWILEVISDPVEKLQALCRHHALFTYENKPLVWVLEREVTFERGTTRTLLAPLRRFLELLEDILVDCAHGGHLRDGVDPSQTAMAFHTTTRALLLYERVHRTPIESQEEFLRRSDAYVQTLLRGILNCPG